MKIAIILGAFSIGNKPLNFSNIWDNSRGLTGTSLCRISQELRNLGHNISIFTVYSDHSTKIWDNNIKLYNFEERFNIIDNSFDAIISLNEPDVFRGIKSNALKICYQFLNDFYYCGQNFDSYVDQWLTVCDQLKEYLLNEAPYLNKNKWKVIPLGCDPNLYQDKRIKNRIVWTSSGDRGLHNLLGMWEEIREAVPNAHLKIFYKSLGNSQEMAVNPNDSPIRQEMCNRIVYINDAIEKLKDCGVEYVGSVSYNEMTKQMNEASILAFPCDTVRQTEGFSLSILQSLASYTVPIITDQDCLGSIYNNSGAVIIKSPVRNNLEEYKNAVIKALIDQDFANERISECREFAFKHTWQRTAHEIEKIILESKK